MIIDVCREVCARPRVAHRCLVAHAHVLLQGNGVLLVGSGWHSVYMYPCQIRLEQLSLVRHEEAEKRSTDMDARTHPAHLHDVRAVDVKRCRDHAEAQISRHDPRVSVICSTCPSVWRSQLMQKMPERAQVVTRWSRGKAYPAQRPESATRGGGSAALAGSRKGGPASSGSAGSGRATVSGHMSVWFLSLFSLACEREPGE